MLVISSAQIKRLDRHMVELFAARIDSYLHEALSPRWGELDEDTRRQRVRRACERGIALRIDADVYLAQFAVLHVLGGEPFMSRPEAHRILHDDSMGWRERMYQLIALAGIDLSAGVPRDD